MKKRILVIPDVHGRTFWKAAVEKEDFEKVIFLGDYVDPYSFEGINPQMAFANFMDVLSLKKADPDGVILLLGNHDLSYVSDYFRSIACGSRFDYRHAEELHNLFNGCHGYFRLAHEEIIGGKRYLFTHAGVTQPWFKQNIQVIEQPDADHLNNLLTSKEGIEALGQVGRERGGSYKSGSMVWADIDDLDRSEPLADTYQIVGHSLMFDGPVITDRYACLDCRAAFYVNDDGSIEEANSGNKIITTSMEKQFKKVNYSEYEGKYDERIKERLLKEPESIDIETMRANLYGYTFTKEYADGKIPDELSMDYWEEYHFENDALDDSCENDVESMLHEVESPLHEENHSPYYDVSPQEELILKTIDSTGDGKTPETALCVIDVQQEYEYIQRVIRLSLLQLVRQSVMYGIDCLELEDYDGSIEKVYFDIGRRFEVEPL